MGWVHDEMPCSQTVPPGKENTFKRHLFSIGLSAVVEKVGKQKVLHVSRATREVLRAGRKAPWRLLASTAPLGLECNGEEHSQTQEGAQEVGGRPMSMWQLLLTRLTSVRATPTQHPLHRCLLPASCLPGAGRLSCPFSIFPNSWLPPQLPPGPSVEPDGPVLSPRGSGDPVCVPAAASVPFTLTPCVHRATLWEGGASCSTSAEEAPLCLGARPSWATESWAGDPCVQLCFRRQPAASSPACGEMCESGGGELVLGFCGYS